MLFREKEVDRSVLRINNAVVIFPNVSHMKYLTFAYSISFGRYVLISAAVKRAQSIWLCPASYRSDALTGIHLNNKSIRGMLSYFPLVLNVLIQTHLPILR